MQNPLINFLVWSENRAKSFQSCQRQYGYRHLEAWGGWRPEASENSRYAYFCNSIVPDLRMVTGSIVHDRCGRVLKRLATGLKSHVSHEITIAEEEFDKFLSDSIRFPLTALGSKRKKLLAHVYGDEVSKNLITSERNSISVMLDHFFALPEVQLFTEQPQLLHRDFIEAEMGPPTQELGVPARLMTDAVYEDKGAVRVLDWKTGQPHESHEAKGVVYDIFVRHD